jgi:UDP-GlcNAc:undecaprenyl-phosphate GlcNAc-1-phosphate transferase
MYESLHLTYLYPFGLAFVLSIFFTYAIRRFALCWNILDHPYGHKSHRDPVPLLGGVAIVTTFFLITILHLLALSHTISLGTEWIEERLVSFLGEDSEVKLGGILAGSFIIFLLGVVDDVYALTPWLKLIGQVAAALMLVLSGLRIELFIPNFWISAGVTILWVVFMTNAMNFIDNMDGLCGGISVIAALSFFLGVRGEEVEFVRFILLVFAGSMAGFLYHNLNPARIFMGDAGAMFSGYLLATVAVVGTFHVADQNEALAVAAPLLALSVPIFDAIGVIIIRWRSGQSIMLGDKRHFSHRLVDLGMTQRQAVAFIFLVAGIVGLGGALLPILDRVGTIIVLAQTFGIFLLIVLLMNAGRRVTEKHE